MADIASPAISNSDFPPPLRIHAVHHIGIVDATLREAISAVILSTVFIVGINKSPVIKIDRQSLV